MLSKFVPTGNKSGMENNDSNFAAEKSGILQMPDSNPGLKLRNNFQKTPTRKKRSIPKVHLSDTFSRSSASVETGKQDSNSLRYGCPTDLQEQSASNVLSSDKHSNINIPNSYQKIQPLVIIRTPETIKLGSSEKEERGSHELSLHVPNMQINEKQETNNSSFKEKQQSLHNGSNSYSHILRKPKLESKKTPSSFINNFTHVEAKNMKKNLCFDQTSEAYDEMFPRLPVSPVKEKNSKYQDTGITSGITASESAYHAFSEVRSKVDLLLKLIKEVEAERSELNEIVDNAVGDILKEQMIAEACSNSMTEGPDAGKAQIHCAHLKNAKKINQEFIPMFPNVLEVKRSSNYRDKIFSPVLTLYESSEDRNEMDLIIKEIDEERSKWNEPDDIATEESFNDEILHEEYAQLLKISMIPLAAADVWKTECNYSHLKIPKRGDQELLKGCWKVRDNDVIKSTAEPVYF